MAYGNMKHFPYMGMCLDKFLRIFPLTLRGLPSETPLDGIKIVGGYLPGGAIVSILSFVAHRSEASFPQAENTELVTASTFLPTMEGMMPNGAFRFHCDICSIVRVFIISCCAEVKGMLLEAIREVFANGFEVDFSTQWRRDFAHWRRK
ncbi:uncharacterized protein F4807DRAFT_463789 [Annulohypoxylon truncatum]|uniref:uncharacterized protein n=1 Tax=Annulohypoxylon truncatum TaxID=327061 RepID=UPI0020087BA2|nr:uncharacterized protein F4807DRAFT_463789 [Annulohypoxylon truncatum]KAI1206299.1 hypothetical protein F4807DRAFT_463789 [Annulohypoxylon truncatum]